MNLQTTKRYINPMEPDTLPKPKKPSLDKVKKVFCLNCAQIMDYVFEPESEHLDYAYDRLKAGFAVWENYDSSGCFCITCKYPAFNLSYLKKNLPNNIHSLLELCAYMNNVEALKALVGMGAMLTTAQLQTSVISANPEAVIFCLDNLSDYDSRFKTMVVHNLSSFGEEHKQEQYLLTLQALFDRQQWTVLEVAKNMMSEPKTNRMVNHAMRRVYQLDGLDKNTKREIEAFLWK